MIGNMKGLSWFRLIALQLVIGSMFVGLCAYFFRIPVEEVQKLPSHHIYSDQALGVPLSMDIHYPGLDSVTIDDPKELLKLKQTFYELLLAGNSEPLQRASSFSITGMMFYLDQDPVSFTVNAKSFAFDDEHVNSLNVSASIRKLQSMFIDKVLTESIISKAVNEPNNEVLKLVDGQMLVLTFDEKAALTQLIQQSARVIDYSRITKLDYQPIEHYVIRLNHEQSDDNHWLHIDLYEDEYFVVYDLLDETNHRAYFIINSTK